MNTSGPICNLQSAICNRARARGQSAVLIALALPFLVAFILLVVEVAERWLEVAMVEDALQQATRSAVQSLDYAAMAQNADGLRATADCTAVTRETAGPCTGVIRIADQFLRTNLTGVRGLGEPAEDLAARVRWTVRPSGGTCSFSGGGATTETTPLLCAEVRPVMTGIVGWGDYTPLITAADTLDAIRQRD
jgi:Flp pilus assembly protein TadG